MEKENNQNTKGCRKTSPWLFLGGTLVWTWSFLGVVAYSGRSWLEFPVALLTLLGGLGPVIVPVVLIHLGYWDTKLDDSSLHFLRRCFSLRTVSPRWLVGVITLAVVWVFLPVLLDQETIGAHGFIHVGPTAFLLIGFVVGALEEVGWRGYAQESLQRDMSVLSAGLVIGVFWALWHLPLFLINGTYQQGLGIGTGAFWVFHLMIILSSPLYGWLYNAAGRAIAAPVLFHGISNVLHELAPPVANHISMMTAVALTVVIMGLNWRLISRPNRPKYRRV